MKTILFTLIITLFITATVFQSCKKDEEKANQLPTCKITYPLSGQEIAVGDTIIISVEVDDKDGSIAEVQFAIDGVGKISVTSSPFIYNWVTDNESIGLHTLETTCIDDDGGRATDEITIKIIEPLADFSSNVTSGIVPLSVAFTDQSTGSPTAWQWEFEPGNISSEQNPTHVYTNDGTYSVTLTTTSSYGTNTITKTDYITVTGSSPVADFSASIITGIAPLSVNFYNLSINKPTTWLWDFDNGETSTIQSPTHIFDTDGKYTVSLTVSNEYGTSTKIKTNYIFVGSTGEPCSGIPTVTDADGNIYNTVQIGEQCWMKENLRVGMRIVNTQAMTNNSIIEKYCYDNDSANCEIYGGLYQWNEMMQYTTTQGAQGICPSGWHIPSDYEWKQMEMALGMTQKEANKDWWRNTNQGGKMKEAGTAHWNPPNQSATNSSGLTALPGGISNSHGFIGIGTSGYWWVSTESSSDLVWTRGLSFEYSKVYRDGDNWKANGRSVRCIKN